MSREPRNLDTQNSKPETLHGAAFDSPAHLARYSVALVLGEHQGCPNAVLEALAAGVPVVANDSGGTRELVIDGRTGLLLAGRDPREIAAALARVVGDRVLARRLSDAGRRHVLRRYSMKKMAAALPQAACLRVPGTSKTKSRI